MTLPNLCFPRYLPPVVFLIASNRAFCSSVNSFFFPAAAFSALLNPPPPSFPASFPFLFPPPKEKTEPILAGRLTQAGMEAPTSVLQRASLKWLQLRVVTCEGGKRGV